MAKKAKPFVKELFAAPLVASGELSESASKELREKALEQLTALPGMPEDVKKLLAERLSTDPITGLGFLMAAGMALGYMTISAVASPFFTLLNYQTSKLANQYRLDPGTVSRLWLRGFPKGQNAEEWAKLSPEEKKAASIAQKEDVEKWFGELSDQGFGGHEQEAIKELAHILPTPQDLVMWMAREVFEPDSVEKYGLKDELAKLDLTLFEKVGVSEEMAGNYWMAHWQHTSFGQMIELLHRGLLTGEREPPAEPTTREGWEARDAEGIKQLYEWYRLVEITPFWRDLLTEATWNIPTRVDVRRWYDMGTINEDELRSIYHRQGYHGKDLDKYVLWTKVYVHFPDLMSRYKNGWITLEEVKKQLVTVDGMPEERFEQLLQTKIKAVQEERLTETTALTRSLIIKGAKEDKLSPEETIELLMLKNYSRWEAEYIYDIEVGAASSPETPMEFRQLVESYRHAVGLEFKKPSSIILEADRKRSDLRIKLAGARSRKAPEDEIAKLQADLEIAEVTFQNMKAAEGL